MKISESLPLDHVALALVLLKCKPQGVVLEDFVSALRLSLAESSVGEEESLNGTKLWHTLFSRMQRQSLDMRAELAVLRPMQEAQSINQDISAVGRKRKLTNPASNKANTQSKRRKAEDKIDFEVVLDTIQTTEQHKDRSLLLRVMFGLARHPQGPPSQPDGLTHSICLACEAILESLDSAIDTSTAMRSSTAEPLLLGEVCAAIQRIWTSIMIQLSKIFHTPGVDYDMITSQLCPIVQRLLRRLHHYCLNEAAELIRNTNKAARSRKSNTKSVISRNAKRTKLFNHNCIIMTKCLAHVLYESNNLQSISEDAFQALATVFLEHLGSSISFQIFADPASTNNQGGLIPPRGLLDVVGLDQRTAIQAAKLEGPHLVTILQALMRHENQKGQLKSLETLQKLQESLVRGMFEENKELAPVSNFDSEEDPTSPPVADDEECDEFISQVWDVLGWDIILDQAQSGFSTTE